MQTIFITCAVVCLFLCLLCDARGDRRRKAKLEAISVAPLPHLPLSFGWNWWGIVLSMAVPIFILGLFWIIGASVGTTALFVVPGLLAMILPVYYVCGYLRFALRGPSFVLDANGVAFAGSYLLWRDVSAIDYVTSGRAPHIRFRHIGAQATGFSIFEQFFETTAFSTYLISDPDGLVGWSRRLKEESQ
jgi:hypothetical protein